jgi:hypothetical protein
MAVNTHLVTTLQNLISQHGAEVLDDTKRVKAYLADYAAQEPKAQRNTLLNCLQYGFHAELQKKDAAERPLYKNRFAQQLYDELGTDTALCKAALDVLEAALFGEVMVAQAQAQAQVESITMQSVPPGSALVTPEAADPSEAFKPPLLEPDHRKWNRGILIAIAGFVTLCILVPMCQNAQTNMAFDTPPALTTVATVPITYATVREDLNMRSGPSVDYTVVRQLLANSRVEVVENTGVWIKICFNNQEGFVNRTYVRIDSAPTQVAASSRGTPTPPSYTRLPPPAPPTPPPVPTLPSISIVNNTGYTANYVYVSQSDSSTWGNTRLSGVLNTGYYLEVKLAESLRVTDTYDIRLRMADNHSYSKYNVRITDNARIVFTSSDRD